MGLISVVVFAKATRKSVATYIDFKLLYLLRIAMP